MKFLFDLFPILLFFIAYKVADIYVATGVAIAATIGQVAYLKLRKRRVDTMLWVSLAIIVVFGGATIWLHDPLFIKWKPTILYWLFAVVLLGGLAFARVNFIRKLLGEQMQLPDPIWHRLCIAWGVFFAAMGALNLFVAYAFSENAWVNFKLFGGMGLLFAFAVAQGVWVSKYLPQEESKG